MCGEWRGMRFQGGSRRGKWTFAKQGRRGTEFKINTGTEIETESDRVTSSK